MKKVLIIHGWPQKFRESHVLHKFFSDNRYTIIAPYLFSTKFAFTSGNITNYLLRSLNKTEPDIIIGMSIGGLIAPYMAERFPKSKLILVATCTKFNPISKTINWFVKNIRISVYIYGILKLIPLPILFWFYRLLDPYYGNKEDSALYEIDMKNNIIDMKQIERCKLKEIMNFILSLNNEKILRKLNNQTLILAGNKDIFMPLSEAIRLSNLIKKSKLVLLDKSHFDVLTNKTLRLIDEFI